MTPTQALAALAAAAALLVAGLTWQFGAWGLIGSGIGLAAVVLFVVDVKERHEAVADAPRRRHRHEVHVPRPR